MKQKTVLLFLTAITMIKAQGQEAVATSGKLVHLINFVSQYVDARNIDIWLPDDYSDKEKYAVLYMHDGQSLYDASVTWNKQSWNVSDTAGKLIANGLTQKFIVVGIWNNGLKRHPEYFPQRVYEALSQENKDFMSNELQASGRIKTRFQSFSDNYLQFIVTELKPYIDKTFSVKPDRAHTFIAGSSMGGLISMYAICEYPEVFGGAACISTHWTGIFRADNNPIPDFLLAYFKNHLPDPKTHLLYFDYGDQTLDALYPIYQQKADVILKTGGYSKENWITKFYPGKDHSEQSWAQRLEVPLQFLLKQ